ncbi:MAG: hypothetical protein HOB34_07015, partial [Nitrospina sp.]|nr:hypothetical protein [Nitrospina sp.]
DKPMFVEVLAGMLEVTNPTGKIPVAKKENFPGEFFALRAKGTDPKLIADIVNTWATIWIDENKKMKMGELTEILKITRTLYNQVKASLENDYGLRKTNQTMAYEFGKTNRTMILAALKNKLETQKQQLQAEPVFFIPAGTKISGQEYPPLNDNRVYLQSSILDLEVEIETRANSLKNLRNVPKNLQMALVSSGGVEVSKSMEVELAEKRIEANEVTFMLLSRRLRDVEVKLSGITSGIRLAYPSLVPNIPISPNPIKIVFYAAVISFILASIVAVSREHLYS